MTMLQYEKYLLLFFCIGLLLIYNNQDYARNININMAMNTAVINSLKPNISVAKYENNLLSQTNIQSSIDLQLCSSCEKPKEENILKFNKIWQYTDENNSTRHFVLGIYYDSRDLAGPYLKVVPIYQSTESKLPPGVTYYILVWFKELEKPVNIKCAALHTYSAFRSYGGKHGKYHYTHLLRCPLPISKEPLHPTHASLTTRICEEHPTIFFPITFPEEGPGKDNAVSACVKCLFGNFTVEKAPYLVSWLESMKMFGMTEIFVDEDFVHIDPTIERIFQFYIKSGFLHMRKMPNNLVVEKPEVDAMVSQVVMFSISSDCLYRNIHKYRYILHIDFDEIVVPRKYDTYMETINGFLENNPDAANASSLTSYSAPFYTYFSKGNPEAPDYVPILQYTYRMPHEIPGEIEAAGERKTFDSTKNCELIHIHSCGPSIKGIQNFGLRYFPPEEMLVHHYRSNCRYQHMDNGKHCPPKNYTTMNDKYLWTKFGDKLVTQVSHVLDQVGYFQIK